jgi:hypothetical protein
MSDDDAAYVENEFKSDKVQGSIKVKYVKTSAVLNEIKDIRTKINASGIEPDDKEGNAGLLKRLRDEHKDFSTSHTVVLRWMVEMRQYDERAFLTYAKNHVKGNYKDRKEFWEAQAEYLVLLFKRLNPRVGIKTVYQYRKNVFESIKKDDEEFMSAKEEAKNIVAEIKKKTITARKDRIIKLLELRKKNMTNN